MTLNQPVGIPFQNTLSYVGPDMNIIPIKRFPREPTTEDKKYRIGQFAIIGRDPSTGTEGELWYLARFESNGDATWIQFDTGTPGVGIDGLLSDDGLPAVGPDINGNVGVLGGTGIVTSGQDPSTAITIAVDGSVVTTQYDGDSGSATPTAGILNIVGGNGTVTSASGNTITLEMQSPFVGDFTFRSNTGGDTELFTVENTVDQASSEAIILAKTAGTSSAATQFQATVGSAHSWAWGVDPSINPLIFSCVYNNAGTVSPGTFDNRPVRLEIVGGVGAVKCVSKLTLASEGEQAGGTVDFNIQNVETDANSDCRINLQVAGGGTGGNAYIAWTPLGGSYSLGVDRDDSNKLKLTAGSTLSGAMRLEFDSTNGNATFGSTGYLQLPSGTTAQRPGTPANGMIRYNTTTAKFEGYEAGAWANLI